MSDFHSGFIAIVGKPNAGKSTLMNALVGEKVSIVTWRPQTTRNNILGILNGDNYQAVFIDTPGVLKPKNHLGDYMKESIERATDDVNGIVYVIDAGRKVDVEDTELLNKYIQTGIPVIVAVNKVDEVTPDKLHSVLVELNKLQGYSVVIHISALRGKNLEKLKEIIIGLLTDDIKYYDDDMYTDSNINFLVTEIIREKAMRLLEKEVPYGIGVSLNKFEEKTNGMVDIDANIYCEKAAHKPIIIGKGGSMLKKIGTYSRQDIETLLNQKVYLALWVKVKEDWRDSDLLLKQLGYNKKDL